MSKRAVGVLVLALGACTTVVDPETHRAYPCLHDGGTTDQCPGGWRCGLEGFCHDPAVGAPYLCQSGQDCEQQWHCGVAGVCYDLSVAGAVPCRFDGGGGTTGDCNSQWRCGLNSICHPLGVAAPYACLGDQDCEAAWRCGPGDACLDPSVDALRPNAYQGPLDAGRLSPLLYDSLPDVLAASVPEFDSSSNPLRQLIGFVSNQTLSGVMYWPEGATLVDGGWIYPGGATFADLQRTPLGPGPVSDLAAFGDTLYLLRDGGLTSFQWTASGLVPADIPLGGLAATQLRIAPANRAITPLLAMSSNQVLVLDLRTGLPQGPFGVVGVDGGLETLSDATLLLLNSTNTLVVTAEEGIFVGAFDAGGIDWHPVEGLASSGPILIPNVRCDALAPGLLHADRILTGANGVLASTADPDAGVFLEPFKAFMPAASRFCDGGYTVIVESQDAPGALSSLACPPGSTWIDSTIAPFGGVYPRSRCRFSLGDGGEYELSFDNVVAAPLDAGSPACNDGAECERRSRTIPQRSEPRVGALAGEHGELWTVFGLTGAVLLDRPFTYALDPELPVPVDVVDLFPYAPGVGQVSEPLLRSDFTQIIGPVDGAPDWSIVRDLISSAVTVRAWAPVDSPARPGSVVADVDTVPGPATAALGNLPDGGLELVLWSNDALIAGALPGGCSVSSCSGAGAALLRLVIVPASQVPIMSAAVRSAQSAQDDLSVYALTSNGLFLVTERSEHDWESQLIQLPAGDWRTVWLDGARGRLGGADGTILSLPSRVPLAESFPGGASLLQYAQLCGQAYAVTTGGLVRLDSNPDGGATGVWVPEPVDDLLPQGPSRHFTAGSLQALSGSLYLSTAFGTTLKLTPETPCQ